jgi:uncharacterized protein (DUF302 family)
MPISRLFAILIMLVLGACSTDYRYDKSLAKIKNEVKRQFKNNQQGVGEPPCVTICDGEAADENSAIYEVKVKDGVSYEDVIDSLKSLSEGANFVNPANFPIAEHIQKRGVDPQGIKEVRSFCNLSMGTEIFLDHPEFLVYAPCRIALYEKPDSQNKMRLYIGLARPTYDLKNIKNPTERAQKAAELLEENLIKIVQKASRGDI